MNRALRLAVVSTALFVLSALGSGAASAQVVTMDFTGLPEGLLVSGLSSGAGITGDAVPGTVRVFGDRAPVGDGSRNAAIVYDAACHGGGPASCSGGEEDKFKPMLGNVLTIGKSNADGNGDGLADSPDTSGTGGELRLDFSSFGSGSLTVRSLDVLDAERGGWIRLYARGALVAAVRFGPTLNNGLATVALGQSGIDRMEIGLEDSGVIDNVRLAFQRVPSVCRSLRLSARGLAQGRRSVVWASVRDTRGLPVAAMRVVARGAGVRTSGVTNVQGVTRLLVRPRRAGVVSFAVPNSPPCVGRLAVRGRAAVLPRPAVPLAG